LEQFSVRPDYDENDVNDFIQLFHKLSETSEFKPFDFTLTTFWGEAAVRAGFASRRTYTLLENGNPIGLFQGLVQRKFVYKKVRAGSTSGNGIAVLPGYSENVMQFFLSRILKSEKFSDVVVFAPPSLSVPNFLEKRNYTFYVRLELEFDEIFRGMDRKTRNRVRKAEKEGVRVEFADSMEALRKAYDVINMASDENAYSVPPWSYTVQLHECFKQRNCRSVVALGFGKGSEKVISAAHLISFDKKLVLWQAGSTEEGYGLNAGSLVQAQIIKWGKDNGDLIYDMGGTNPVENMYAGIHRFKSGFGGRLVTNKLLRKSAFYVPAATRIYRTLRKISLKNV
jgi:hypothetical protein